MNVALLILGVFLFLSLVMAAAWAIALCSRQSGWIDAIWSFAVGAAGLLAALAPIEAELPTARQLLVAALAAIWSLRLGLHIVGRTIGGDDDPRYAHLREEWGGHFRRRLFWFLQLQAAAALPLVVSIFVAARNPSAHLGAGDLLGAVLLLTAIAGETIADHQLAHFRSDPANKGRICDRGLWGLSRHPNYFFEWLGWLAYVPIAIAPGGAFAWGWLALGGPIFMYWLLVHVSGLPPLEAHMLRSRGAVFVAYEARVNAFWPGPPRGRG